MTKFDPNAASTENSGIFGLPFKMNEANLVYIPVPWEATTSYGGGTSLGPEAIFEASKQVDLFDLEIERPYEAGLFMVTPCADIVTMNEKAKSAAQKIIEVGGQIDGRPELQAALELVNGLGNRLNENVKEQVSYHLAQGKIVALIGGDHSTPFGAFQAIADRHPGFGILHFDAHSDTRDAYEGFKWSHASIMRNTLDHIPQVLQLVQVGIRDFCEEESDYCAKQKDRVKVFYDTDLKRRKYAGETWAPICQEIVSHLPNEVWISFDIDGLDPTLCPHTGTPVPGGLDFNEACFIIRTLVESGRKIVGFDLNEVAPDPEQKSEWDANVGARLLYKMTAWCLASQELAKIRAL